MRKRNILTIGIAVLVFMLVVGTTREARAQQKELPEVSMLTAVPNFAFAAIWVAEQPPASATVMLAARPVPSTKFLDALA